MALFTTTQAGNASQGSTWVGGVAPNLATGSSDTWQVNHALVVDVDAYCGSSGAEGTAALTTGPGASATVTVAAGKTLTARGDVVLQGNNTARKDGLVLNAGANIELDSHLAAAPSTTHYGIRVGNNNFQYVRIKTNGTAGARCQIRANAGGASAWMGPSSSSANGNDFLDAGFYNFAYTDVIRFGTASVISVRSSVRGGSLTAGVSADFAFDHTTFDTCGDIDPFYIDAAVPLDLQYVTFKNSVGPQNIGGNINSMNLAANPTYARQMIHCVFDKRLNGAYDMRLVQDCVFLAGYSVLGTRKWLDSHGHFIRSGTNQVVVTNQPNGSNLTESYLLNDSGDVDPHMIGVAAGGGGETDIDDNIFELQGTTSGANGILGPPGAPTALLTVKARRNLFIPDSAAAGGSGELFVTYGAGNLEVYLEHNTQVGLAEANAALNIQDAGAPIRSFKSNLIVDQVAGRLLKIGSLTAVANTGDAIFTGANVDYNGGYNLKAGTYGKGYDLTATTAPGAHDVDGQNPNFVDSTRRIASFDASLGGPGTLANFLAQIAKLNDADYDSRYNVADLKAFVRGGFMPQATAHRTAAHDGTTIGAVQYVSPGPTAKQKLFYRMSQYAAAIAGLITLPLSIFGARHV